MISLNHHLLAILLLFFSFSDVYKEEKKYDRLCFDDMKKSRLYRKGSRFFSADKSRNFGITFTVYDGDNYRLGQNGDIIKVQSD
ncbi:DUF943 family protein [Salmonella enterica subsp. arizonae]|nr:DUF943 family protein [Salmonella enterica subsp. arizonae]